MMQGEWETLIPEWYDAGDATNRFRWWISWDLAYMVARDNESWKHYAYEHQDVQVDPSDSTATKKRNFAIGKELASFEDAEACVKEHRKNLGR